MNFAAWSLGCFLLGVGVMSYYRVIQSGKALKALHIKQQPFSHERVSELTTEARRRTLLYDDLISKDHLVNNMVVNRHIHDWQMQDQCDSLLFSSLRFIALHKLGLTKRADSAWNGIRQVVLRTTVMRHPQCSKPPSRDMILGLLGALVYQPPGGKDVFVSIVKLLDRNSGFFSHEKTHYSFLTPQIAQLLRHLAATYGLATENLPLRLVHGYSTHELESLLVEGGYRAHLIALTVWVELELIRQAEVRNQRLSNRSLTKVLDHYGKQLLGNEIKLERLQFVTQALVDVDPNNLFFRWLRLKTAGILTDSAPNQRILYELLNMPQFPKGALPMNCDRGADYVWMRHTDESLQKATSCYEQFSGVDFLWLAALVLEDIESFD